MHSDVDSDDAIEHEYACTKCDGNKVFSSGKCYELETIECNKNENDDINNLDTYRRCKAINNRSCKIPFVYKDGYCVGSVVLNCARAHPSNSLCDVCIEGYTIDLIAVDNEGYHTYITKSENIAANKIFSGIGLIIYTLSLV